MDELPNIAVKTLVVSCFAGLIISGPLIFLNLDGYHIGLPWLKDFNEEPPNINWTHGWPWRFMGRSSIYSTASGISAPTPASIAGTVGNEIGITSRWPFDEAPISYFVWRAMLADVAFLIVLTVGTVFAVRRFAGHLRVHFGMRSLLIVMTAVAGVLAFQLPSRVPRQVPEVAAMLLIAIAILLIIYSAIKFMLTRIFVVSRR